MEAEARNSMKLHGAAALVEQMEAEANRNMEAADSIKCTVGPHDQDYIIRLNVARALQTQVDKFTKLLYSSDNDEIQQLKDEALAEAAT